VSGIDKMVEFDHRRWAWFLKMESCSSRSCDLKRMPGKKRIPQPNHFFIMTQKLRLGNS